jgi:hypothetical protein
MKQKIDRKNLNQLIFCLFVVEIYGVAQQLKQYIKATRE